MASFFSGSTNQIDGNMPQIYLRDPNHTPYPESTVQGNMRRYVHYASSGPYTDTLAVSTQLQQHCIELPVSSAITLQDSFVGGPDTAYNASHIGDNNYNSGSDGRSEMLLMQTIGAPSAEDFVQSSHLGLLNGHKLSLEQTKGLSLSLSTQIPVPSFQYQPTVGNDVSCRDDSPRHSQMHVNSSSYGVPNFTNSIANSKYLKAAQQLLDEVVNVREALKQKADRSESLRTSGGTAGCTDIDGGSKSDGVPSNPQESTAYSSSQLSPSERQDLQNKVTKLLAMVDEVDRRYKHYYHQMQIVVSSFDAIAGSGAAKLYTALALQTISCHFRCLRDAISTQIRATRKSLGEQENSGGKGTGISRLRYIDQQLRQQRAMQQFSMMEPHAWRPQRGLPENSVSILRAWLFEHFLHPYPKDSEKLMLARQTGLTRGQVANWFINARVRLWKPMIEEMYKEEIGDTEIESNSSSENPPKDLDEMKSSQDREEPLQSAASERCQTSQFNQDHAESNLISDVDVIVDDAYMIYELREQRPNGENSNLPQEAIIEKENNDKNIQNTV